MGIYFDSTIEYEYQMNTDFIEKEMHRHKDVALRSLSNAVHSNDVESFAKILSYAFFDSVHDAEKIAKKYNLAKLDFLAINEDLEGFKKEYLSSSLSEMELAHEYAI